MSDQTNTDSMDFEKRLVEADPADAPEYAEAIAQQLGEELEATGSERSDQSRDEGATP